MTGLDLTTDVLVVGGGPAATWAALEAAQDGADVVLADKGYCGTSGATASVGVRYVLPEPAAREAAMTSREALGQPPGRRAVRRTPGPPVARRLHHPGRGAPGPYRPARQPPPAHRLGTRPHPRLPASRRPSPRTAGVRGSLPARHLLTASRPITFPLTTPERNTRA
ncbi:FAD-dependent oxidoreductase [Streptomyces caelestis]|uniref:FAD-dependent oxidoreductase n=1 Tax=Streptomyces heliomycini TaxID=284032 RepID=A0ABV5L6Z6_9ACTN